MSCNSTKHPWDIIKQLGCAKRIWYLSPMRAAKVQASLRIRAVSPEPSLLAHTSSESRRTFRQKARSLVPMNGWACAVKICHDGMLEDTNSLGGAQLIYKVGLYCFLLIKMIKICLCQKNSSKKRYMRWGIFFLARLGQRLIGEMRWPPSSIIHTL